MLEYSFVRENESELIRAVFTTLELAAEAVVFALIVGALVASLTTSRRRGRRSLGRAYIEVMRNTPLLIQLFLIYFGLPAFGLRLSGFASALLALSLQHGAYIGEIYRAGIRSVNPRQTEAALALGMMPRLALTSIVVPQALRSILPALGSQCVALIKDTSLASTIAVYELTQGGKILLEQTGAPYEILLLTATVYLTITSAVLIAFRVSERVLRVPVE